MSECQNKEENIFVEECLKRIETDWNTVHFQRCQVFSQRHFPKGDFPNDNLLSGNFQIVEFPNRQLPKGQVMPSDAPQAAMGAERGGQNGIVAALETYSFSEVCKNFKIFYIIKSIYIQCTESIKNLLKEQSFCHKSQFYNT